MTATAITYSTILSQARENIAAIIENKTYVSDPLTTSAEYRKWIYSRFPDVKARDFGGYPFIIINPATVSYSEQTGKSLDNSRNIVDWSIVIDVYASDRAYGNGSDGQGYAHITAISDDLVEAFNNITVRNTIRANNIQFANIKSAGNDVTDIDKERIFSASFILTFKTRMQVSA